LLSIAALTGRPGEGPKCDHVTSGQHLPNPDSLRIAECIQLVFVCLLVLASQLRPLNRTRRLGVALLASVAIALIAAARFSPRWMSPLASSILRDWLPAALMLVPYWQVGQFFTGSDPATEARLAKFDRVFFRWLGVQPARTRIRVSLAVYLELAYVMDYPLIPLALLVLYTTGLRARVDFFWLVVLSATYVCFALTLLIRASPPRILPGYAGFKLPPTPVRRLNRNILDHASIQAITCPSAHVASSLAAALVLLGVQPWVGLIFLWVALSIAIGTIVGGYHYVADVLLAAAVALLIFGASLCMYR
jgi:membrane-associated phospholipid phosphatase